MRNFCNIFFINFSNISGNYFLILSDQTGRFPFYQRKTPQYFIPGSSTLHQRVLLPFFFLTFPYPFPFFFLPLSASKCGNSTVFQHPMLDYQSYPKLSTTTSSGGLILALQRAITTARPEGRYRKHCYWLRYKAVLLESSLLESSACSLMYFCTASSVILPIVST